MRGRLAGRWEKSDGYVEAGTAFGEPATGRTSNGADGYALRGNLQIDATDDVADRPDGRVFEGRRRPTGEYVVSLAGFDPDTGLGAFTDAIDPATRVDPTDFSIASRSPATAGRHWSDEDPYMNRETTSLTAQVTAQLGGGMELVSITNWLTMDKFYIEDAGGGFGFFPYNTINDYDQWSQELRLSGDAERLRWTGGRRTTST